MINGLLSNEEHDYIKRASHHFIQGKLNPSRENVFYNLKYVEPVFAFYCQGVQLKAPEPIFQSDGRFTLLYNITREGLWNVDKWCHDPTGELFNLDPRIIF